MDTITCIKTRRSIRQFKEQEVTKDVLEDIVQTASFAPSWKNTQTTRYIAITDPKVKARLAEEGCKDYPFNQKNINTAPAIIATTIVDKRSGFERDGSYSTCSDFWCVSIEYTSVMCFSIICIKVYNFRIYFISVVATSLHSHTDTTVYL
mgnify:CR=1 FL=1